MGKSKYLVVLPLALTVLAACGNKDNFSKTDYTKACEIVDNYVESIKNSKASSIEVSGHINKFDIKGDFTWWSLKSTEITEFPESLFSKIPNFSLKDSELKIDAQDIAKFSVTGSLMNVVETLMGVKNPGEEVSMLLLDNLPKFPMNRNMLKLIYGIKIKTQSNASIPWDQFEEDPWTKATINFYTDNGRLKVTAETDDVSAFFTEIKERFSGEKINPEPTPEKKKYPASVTLTTNKIGYIDSVSVKTKLTDFDRDIQPKTELYYIHLKGDAEVDLTLNFKQSISSPLTIKYQLREYELAEEGKGDVTYHGEDLKFVKAVGPTSDLTKLSEYVTFDWYTNFDRNNYRMVKNYDDPIFNMNYWHGDDCAKNVAFTAEHYDVMVFPTIDDNLNPKYKILGAISSGDEVIAASLFSASIDGRIISSDQGLPTGSQKTLETAADKMHTGITFEVKDKDSYYLDADEIFINSNMLKANGSEYVITIPVLNLQAK